jgi:3-dehydroquinate dehydratase-2
MAAPRILILNGPNLNMLGVREPEIYGTGTLADIETLCAAECKKRGWSLDFRQSNHEGELVTWIQEAAGAADGLIINAAAYTHTSIAIHDALKILKAPIIEVHLSNPLERESFRHHSYITGLAREVIAGHGPEGYVMALQALSEIFRP